MLCLRTPIATITKAATTTNQPALPPVRGMISLFTRPPTTPRGNGMWDPSRQH